MNEDEQQLQLQLLTETRGYIGNLEDKYRQLIIAYAATLAASKKRTKETAEGKKLMKAWIQAEEEKKKQAKMQSEARQKLMTAMRKMTPETLQKLLDEHRQSPPEQEPQEQEPPEHDPPEHDPLEQNLMCKQPPLKRIKK